MKGLQLQVRACMPVWCWATSEGSQVFSIGFQSCSQGCLQAEARARASAGLQEPEVPEREMAVGTLPRVFCICLTTHMKQQNWSPEGLNRQLNFEWRSLRLYLSLCNSLVLQLENRWPAFSCAAFADIFLYGKGGTVGWCFIHWFRFSQKFLGVYWLILLPKFKTLMAYYCQLAWPSGDVWVSKWRGRTPGLAFVCLK